MSFQRRRIRTLFLRNIVFIFFYIVALLLSSNDVNGVSSNPSIAIASYDVPDATTSCWKISQIPIRFRMGGRPSVENNIVATTTVTTNSPLLFDLNHNNYNNNNTVISSTKSFLSTTKAAARKLVQQQQPPFHPTGSSKLTAKSFPAFIRRRRRSSSRNPGKDNDVLATYDEKRRQFTNTAIEVSTKIKKRLSRELSNSGVYFGLSPTVVLESYQQQPSKRRIDLREGMFEALDELRTMRKEMEELRKEMRTLQQQISSSSKQDEGDDDVIIDMESLKIRKKKRQKEFEKISKDVEEWATELLVEQLSPVAQQQSTKQQQAGIDGSNNDIEWTEVQCTKVLQSKFNPNGTTRAFITHMKDSRGNEVKKGSSTSSKNGNKFLDPNIEYPCIKMYSTLDAPIEDVCIYLSNEKHVWDYNSLIQEHEDIEVISSNSKICWAQTPQVLFVKPKDFITYCSHRWLQDGTQIVINQALDEYKDNYPSSNPSGKNNNKRQYEANAFAFRGATIIRRDPESPFEKTQIYMLAHGSPGADIPVWAMKTATKSLVPIEPFRLFYRMNQGIVDSRTEIRQQLQQLRQQHEQQQLQDEEEQSSISKNIEMVTVSGGEQEPTITNAKPTIAKPDKSWLPGGIAQLGYACFWPQGGGPIEHGKSATTTSTALHPSLQQRQQQYSSNSDSQNNNSIEGQESLAVDTNVGPSDEMKQRQQQKQQEKDDATRRIRSATIPVLTGRVPGFGGIQGSLDHKKDPRFVIPPPLMY